MTDHAVTAHTQVSAIGLGNRQILSALRSGQTGLRRWQGEHGLQTWVGAVPACEEVALSGRWRPYDCRNNRLAWLALELDGFSERVGAAVRRYGASRIGVFIGTSTSGIATTEAAYRDQAAIGASGPLPATGHSHPHTHQVYSAARLLRERLGLQGPAAVVSTACSSSAKVFAHAARFLDAGLIDAAVVGGIDSLCETTLYGFHALQLTSRAPCRPWDVARDGISIGEAAGLALIEARDEHADLALLGHGETSDAYHMSTPEPHGRHAARAMHEALQRAGVSAAQIDYVNLHATATLNNDRAEDQALLRVFARQSSTRFSATKGLTGHTLGAAGMIESLFCLMALEYGFIPATAGLQTPDPLLARSLEQIPPPEHSALEQPCRPQPIRLAMNNSLGFGGSNASLIFGHRR